MNSKNSFDICSIIRRNRSDDAGHAPVYLRITYDGRRAEISIKVFVDPAKWLPARGRVKGSTEEARRQNASIETFEFKAREIYNKYILNGKPFSAATIKNELLGISENQHFLIQQVEKHVTEMESRIGRGYAVGTVKNWKVTLGHLKEFIRAIYHADDLPLRDLDLSFLHKLDYYASTTWSCRANATLKHIQRLRKIVTKAFRENWIEKEPFAEFKGKYEKTRRTFLTQEELDRIENKEITMPRLIRVRDIFLFSCYTGLAYVDVVKLTPSDVVVGIDKKKWIYTNRTKTGTKSNVPLLPNAISIIEKYSADAQATGRLLPVITNIKTNAYLKEIADICGIQKNLTFHMARHTFATTITLTNGVPIETVSNMLGHTKITTTQIYAKVLEKKVSEDMTALERKLSKS